MRELFVEKEKQDESLIKYICGKFPNLKYSALQKALRNKDIKVNEKRISSDIGLKYNDAIKVYIKDEILFNLPGNVDIIYIDDNILVAFKPQGILSNDEYKTYEPTFEDLVKLKFPEAKICHRIDRNTSGLVIFSRNDKSYNDILNAFKNGNILKEYIAFVSNSKFDKQHDLLEKYLIKDSKAGFAKIYDEYIPNGKKIITEYDVININKKDDYAILKVKIHTGKTHQIRAQMANISHPIIGDQKYGKNEINKKFKTYKQLLIAISYKFSFNKSSKLHYLNNINIELDNSYIPYIREVIK